MKRELSWDGVLKPIHFLVAALVPALSVKTDAACNYCDPGVGAAPLPPAVVTATTPPQIRQIPIKWAGMAGAPSVVNPAGVCAPDFKTMMLRRSEKATSYILCPQTWIILRSGAGTSPTPNFIQLSDPPPSGVMLSNLGDPGDVIYEDEDPGSAVTREVFKAWQEADRQYALAPGGRKGIIALSVGRLRKANGDILDWSGAAPVPATPVAPWIVVVDPTFADCSLTLNGRTVAHEVGHVLGLCHNPSPVPTGPSDTCDAHECCNRSTPAFSNPNLMKSGGSSSTLELNQAMAMRTYLNANATALDPPGDPGELEGRIDVAFDVKTNSLNFPPFLDIYKIMVVDDSPIGGDLSLYLMLEDAVPTNEFNVKYWILLDTDNNLATGGSPTNLIAGNPIGGVDFVAEVIRENPRNVFQTLYHVDSPGVLTPVSLGPGDIEAKVQTLALAFCDPIVTNATPIPPEPFATAVEFRIANSALVPSGISSGAGAPLFPNGLRIQTVSANLGSEDMDFAPTNGVILEFPPVIYPTVAHPPAIALGQSVSFSVTNITPLASLTLRLADQDVPISATTGTNGAATFSFLVPMNLPVMPVLVTVGVQDTNNASTAVSVVEITDPAVPLAINISAGRTNAVLTWNSLLATLQSAETVDGLWTNITAAYSPWTIQYGGQQRFYKVKR